MPEGGDISIRTCDAILEKPDDSDIVGEARNDGGEGPPSGRYAVIEVADKGQGMDSRTLDRLFEPFFTTKEFGKGSGLGLSTAYGIVRQMDGYIQVFTEVGKGSVFRILLPLVAGPLHEPAPAPRIQPEMGSGETLLVVEDESLVRKLVFQILSGCGYKVIEASNGCDALEKLGDPLPHLDLIVTDVMMDRMGGIELALNLNRLYPDVDVLFMSRYAAETYVFPQSDRGESYFLGKPFSPVDFLKKVQGMLAAKRRGGGHGGYPRCQQPVRRRLMDGALFRA